MMNIYQRILRLLSVYCIYVWSVCMLSSFLGKSLELEQPQYFVDGRGTLQGKKGR